MAEEKKDKKEKKPQGEGKPKGEKKAKGADGAPAEAAPAEKKAVKPQEPAKPARLRLRYADQVRAELMKEFGFTNPMQAPRLEKIVVNMGLGEAINNGKI